MARRPKSQEDGTAASLVHPITLEDARLIEQVKDGQTESYGRLVEKYQDRVFNACWRICGNLEDARDVTQEAFLRAFDNISSFRQQSGFYTWLFRVAVNLAISNRRKENVRRALSLDDPQNLAGSQAAGLVRDLPDGAADEPAGALGSAELIQRAAAALEKLDDEYRAVVVLRDIEGLDYREIGEILEIPPGTVKSRLHRGRSALRKAIVSLSDKERG